MRLAIIMTKQAPATAIRMPPMLVVFAEIPINPAMKPPRMDQQSLK